MAELMPMAEQASLSLAGRLLAGSIQGALIVGLVWLACWRIRSIPVSAKAALWWLASLKLVLALVAIPSIPVPILPAVPAPQAVPIEIAVTSDASDAAGSPEAEGVPTAPASSPAPRWPWPVWVIALWLVGVALHAAWLATSWRRLRGVLARSLPVGKDDEARAASLAAAVGLKAPPPVRVSGEIDSPQVVGVLRPVVLLPASVAGALSDEERSMAICHELMHVRRRDLLFGWVPACAERLFFFHPLARLAAREYVIAREAACDAAVLEVLGVAPREYGRVLLRLGVGGGESVLSAAGASTSRSLLKRRLDMLQTITRGYSRRSAWMAVSLMALALVPVHLAARPSSQPATAGAVEPVRQQTQAHAWEAREEAAAAFVRAELEATEARYQAVAKEPAAAPEPAPGQIQEPDASPDSPQKKGAKALSKAREQKRRAALKASVETKVASAKTRVAAEPQSDRILRGSEAGAQQATTEAAQKPIEQQKRTFEELTAMLRELERSLQQATGADANAARARQAEMERAAAQLEQAQSEVWRSARGAAQANTDPQAALRRQFEDVARMQQTMAQRLQDMAKQQETLRATQAELMKALEQLRLSVDRVATPAPQQKK